MNTFITYNKLKRLMDVSLSSVGLCLFSPLILAAVIAVKIDSKGSAFYPSLRVGKNGREFSLYKIRSMVSGKTYNGPQVTSGVDTRITSVGRLLRKTKIDELPQLYNVLIGDVSLVGPRPEAPIYVEKYLKEYKKILSIRPGLTDRATIEFIGEEEILAKCNDPESFYVNEIMPKKIALYLDYVEKIGFAEDLRITIKTMGKIIKRTKESSSL